MTKTKQDPISEIPIHYLKSSFSRVVHCDGAIGGITPRGLLHCSLFSERHAIPQVQVHAVEDKRLGALKQSAGREGVVREMEVDVVFNLQTAKDLREWLDLRIAELEKLKDDPAATKKKNGKR